MFRKTFVLFFSLLPLSGLTHAQDSKLKSIEALKISLPPKIDGILDEALWKNAATAKDFIQDEPNSGFHASQKTEVKIAYTDNAIYVAAMMYDTHPDSILHELGGRDQVDELNADAFGIGFDTYNKQADAYIFFVSASGVQSDFRWEDETYDAVWESATHIGKDGWSVEIKIPYSALRFPDNEIQNWRVQMERRIRRLRETSRWNHIPKNVPVELQYFGNLLGLSNLKSPLRLSLTPYLSTFLNSTPTTNSAGGTDRVTTTSYSGGADLKWGLDERFTLDMTLLPDFSQVQSDKKVKNLSYFETTYEENRPFFKEGTEFFNKNALFYSRRIGRIPMGFYSVNDSLSNGEILVENPQQAKLLNAVKLTGRTSDGFGVGLLNAVTSNTYAVAKDTLGVERSILTEPFANYNVFTINKQFKSNAKAYIINTNVGHNDGRTSNVTGSAVSVYNKSKTIQLDASGVLSNNHSRITKNQTGYLYFFGLNKVGGTYWYGISHEALSNNFNATDLGYFRLVNATKTDLYLNYNKYESGKKIISKQGELNLNLANNFLTHKPTEINLNASFFTLFRSRLGLHYSGGILPFETYDYYEPRVAGRYFIKEPLYYLNLGGSSDYRKKLALDFYLAYGSYLTRKAIEYTISPDLRYRISDRLTIRYKLSYNPTGNNQGRVEVDSLGQIIFGSRKLLTLSNSLSLKYIFSPIMSFSLNTRYYWSTGHYLEYYTLNNDGRLEPNATYKNNNDFSYDAFNIDAFYTWWFAPGSTLSIVYKNALERDEIVSAIPTLSDDFNTVLTAPKSHNISLKFIYYLDYQDLKRN